MVFLKLLFQEKVEDFINSFKDEKMGYLKKLTSIFYRKMLRCDYCSRVELAHETIPYVDDNIVSIYQFLTIVISLVN